MKHSIKFGLMGGMILFCLSMCLTSCEDILGEWSKPVPNTVTPGGGDGGGSSTINATDIKLDQTMKVIKLGGDALTINVTFTPSDATDKSVTWESNKETVATVNNGVVTPVGLGIATITAKSGDLTATCEVFVGKVVDLSSEGANYPVQNYDILKGNLLSGKSITIPDGVNVAFDGITTDRPVTCEGDATIYLTDGSINSVCESGVASKAGIKVGGTGKTLTIDAETAGTGTLTTKGGQYAAGIGPDEGKICGDITINGGTIIATGGDYGGAGIGSADSYDYSSACGDITINGGTVTATGGSLAAGIGVGAARNSHTNSCGAITISANVTSVTATKGSIDINSIGKGKIDGGTANCGDIYFDIKVATAGAYSITTTDGTYTHGGLNLVISGNDWTLTPAN